MVNAGIRRGASQSAPGLVRWLFDPFTYVAGGWSLTIGLAAIVLAGLLGSFSNTHFDGVLDFHSGRPAGVGVFLLEGMVDWLALAVVLLLLGKLASRGGFRAIDLFGTQAMARWPTVVIAAASLAPPFRRVLTVVVENVSGLRSGIAAPPMDLAVFGLVVLVSILAAVWMVALMYRSYSVCCNITGGKAVATFIIGVLAAEVLSKVAVLGLIAA